MPIRRFPFLALVMAVCAIATNGIGSHPRHENSSNAEEVTLTEAEILLYFVPEAKELRSHGLSVGWEQQTGAKLNQADFYIFWVVDNKRPGVHGSVTVGYFAVNKYTGDVWNMDKSDFVSTPEITGIQEIVRKTHSISPSVINQIIPGSLE
jgi:hypothetical protein